MGLVLLVLLGLAIFVAFTYNTLAFDLDTQDFHHIGSVSGAALLTQVPGAQLVSPFGHCTFTLAEVQGAFALLASQVTAHGLALH